MDMLLTDDELDLFSGIPEVELVDLAIELDIPVGESIDRSRLLSRIVQGLAELGRREGLPFSPYDLDDLAALPDGDRRALGQILGCGAEPAAFVKAGKKVYKRYQKHAPRSQVPLLLPMLLPALARCAGQGVV